MKNFSAILFLGTMATHCPAQPLKFAESIRNFGLGTYSTHFSNAFSFCANPAAVASVGSFEAGILSERKYFLKELQLISAAAAIRTGHGGLGLEFHRLGPAEFNQSFIAINYGKRLGKMDLGIRVGTEGLKLAGYKNERSIVAEIGSVIHLTEKLSAGVDISIPHISTSNYYGLGLGYEISENVFAGVQISKSGGSEINSNIGLIYRFAGQFISKIGMNVSAAQPYFSAGWKLKSLLIEAGVNFHQQLGMSPVLTFSYKPEGKGGGK